MRNFFEQILIKVRTLQRTIETNTICMLCKAQPFHNTNPQERTAYRFTQQGCGGYEHLLSNNKQEGEKKRHVTFNMLRAQARPRSRDRA